MYLLDTNICIYIIKNKPSDVLDIFHSKSILDISISSITVAELRYGAEKSSFPEKNHSALDDFLSPFTIFPFDEVCSTYYGSLRKILENKGQVIGSMDLMIASCALKNNLILVTNNTKEFERIPELKIENWVSVKSVS
ncbi:MAG: type II toxin-antitoxin system VapC family toxin [Leptospiraceae bacterium]|nr:type II toxin-antitoxin system VapC family toxin [Leptospiraceae bacterium]